MPSDRKIFRPKRTPTEVKHAILQAYLRAWGGIIINSNQGKHIRLCYVDTCSGSGLYERDPDDPDGPDQEYEVGSAIIGLTELASLLEVGRKRAASISGKALFINESADELETLKAAIAAKVPNAPPWVPKPGLFTEHVDEVVATCQGSFSFVFIDPYGPTAVPFEAVSRVVTVKFTDTIIHYPYYAVEKWTGWLEKGQQEARLALVDAMMNGRGWRDKALEARRKNLKLEPILLGHYLSELNALGVYTCSIPMLFPDRDRVLYHLIFTTRKASGLAAAKKDFQKAEHYQAYLRDQLRVGKTQGTIFDRTELAPADPVNVDELAARIKGRFGMGPQPFEDVAGFGLMMEHVLFSHVQKALRHLKSKGLADFTQPTWKNTISFK